MKWRGGRSPARGSTQGVDGIFWGYFRYYCPPVCYTRCCRGSPASTGHCWCPPSASASPASPATRIPLALKGEEIPTTRFPPWPRTVGLKGSGFPSPHGDASRPRGTAGPPLSAGGSSAPPPALQPTPSEYGTEDWRLLYPASQKLKPYVWGWGWEALQGDPLWVTSE